MVPQPLGARHAPHDPHRPCRDRRRFARGAIDGHQPLDPPASTPVEITPVSAPATGGDGPDAWVLVAVPLTVIGAAGAARKLTHRSLLPHRRARVSV